MTEPRPLSSRTLAAQALGHIDESTRAIVPPIHLATTFERDPDNLYRSGNIYGRPDNETVREAEAVIGALEGAAATLVYGSGMSAAIALFLSLGPGAHVVAARGMYWALRAWLAGEAPAFGISVDFVETEDLQALARAVKPGETRLVWLETPSNPLWGVSDIEGAARIAHAAGAALAVDSTCATPILTRPLALGADVVMHSATKYLNGHSDVIAGVLCFGARRRALRASANDPPQARNDPASVRGVPVDPGIAHSGLTGARRLRQRDGARDPAFEPRGRIRRPLSRAAASSRAMMSLAGR